MMKNNKFLPILYGLTFVVVLIGSTFAYFTQTGGSSDGALAATGAHVGLKLYVEPLYTGKDLIPMNNSDVDTAIQNMCIDKNGYGACQAYTLTVENIGEDLNCNGLINFTLDGITNLNYLLLDEDNNRYVDQTGIVSGTNQTLGNNFTLPKETTKSFKLVIWVPNINENQDDYDGGGNFNAIVTYKSSGNVEVTGSISG